MAQALTPIPASPSSAQNSDGRELTERGQRRKSELMEAAVRIFAEKGFQGTSVAEIVRDVGAGKGVFYWYFDSKEALFGEILREALVELRRFQAEAISDCDDPVERIALGIKASLRYFAENRHLFAMLEQAWSIDAFRARLEEGQEVVIGDTAKHVQEGIARGLIRKGDALFLAHAIFGVATHVARRFVKAETDVDQLADESVAFCLTGILNSHS